MDVLIDTNILINFVTKREDLYSEESNFIMEMCAREHCCGYVAFHSLSILWYVLRKTLSAQETRHWLERLCRVLTITDASQAQVMRAISNDDFPDFEDCLQDECARKVHADYLVTCNVKDYRHAKSRVVAPDTLVRILKDILLGNN